VKDQHAPVECHLSIPNILLNAFDLICNQCRIGWSWSNKPFPAISTWPISITSIIVKLFFKFVLFNSSLYLVQHNTYSPSSTTLQATPYSTLHWACSPAGPSWACTPYVAAWWCTQTLTCSTMSQCSSGALSSNSQCGSGDCSSTTYGHPH